MRRRDCDRAVTGPIASAGMAGVVDVCTRFDPTAKRRFQLPWRAARSRLQRWPMPSGGQQLPSAIEGVAARGGRAGHAVSRSIVNVYLVSR